MRHPRILFLLSALLATASLAPAVSVPVDLTGYSPGAVRVEQEDDSLVVTWPDEASTTWRAVFSLDPEKPLITSIGSDQETIVRGGRPFYRVETGKRRKGWNAFFDFPPSHPEGTRSFQGRLALRSARVRTIGDRVELFFDGLGMGIFRRRHRLHDFPRQSFDSTGSRDDDLHGGYGLFLRRRDRTRAKIAVVEKVFRGVGLPFGSEGAADIRRSGGDVA